MTELATESAKAEDREIGDLPAVYPGFIIAAVFFVIVVLEMKIDPDLVNKPEQTTLLTVLTALVGTAYWLYCIYRIHSVLAAATGGSYPIGPRKAAGFQLIPFFNLYWTYVWLAQLTDYIARAGVKVASRYLLTGILLLGFFTGQLFDASVGLVLIFSVVLYLRRKLQQALPVS
jgi:hypothetical protein